MICLITYLLDNSAVKLDAIVRSSITTVKHAECDRREVASLACRHLGRGARLVARTVAIAISGINTTTSVLGLEETTVVCKL